MAENILDRKLRAILSADVKGYSRLMGEDEEHTIKTITAYRETFFSLISKHKGRVVDSPGDNILAEFASALNAVNSAIEIQETLKEKNVDLPDNRKMEFRIGINLGDIVQEGDRIYGDGVNVAARIEGLADPGGVCISRNVCDQVKKKLTNLGYEYLGEHSVKNIDEPVRVYRVLMDPESAGKLIGEKRVEPKRRQKVALAAMIILVLVVGSVLFWRTVSPPMEVASVENMAYPLPEKPSIAVLPFDNMSGDPGQEYLADGISENIISALSKVSKLFVIARNSTFTYKGKPVKIRQVSEDLGVRYVVEGSVQRSGEKIRITSQLIDAITGNHLWSDRYDRDLKDIFALQDEITIKILAALQVKLTHGEQAQIWAKGTKNLNAYLKLLQAREYYLKMNMESNALARKITEEAIALDSEYADAYSWLGATYILDVFLGSTKSPKDSIAKAIELTQKALALDDSLPVAQSRLGFLYTIIGQHEKGIAEAEKGLALNPNSAGAYDYLGFALRFAGRPEEAIPMIKKALRLNPYPPGAAFYNLGMAYLYTGKCEEAISACEKALQQETDNLLSHITATAAYSMCGKEEEARKTAAEVLRIYPKFNTQYFAKNLPYKNRSDLDRYIEALHKAGLPESPPLPLPDKPSIAVLPFDNLSGDPNQEYLADGISETIISALSKIPKMFVIARNSTFTYKGKPVKVQQISRDLGVRYVFEGGVQKAGDRLRVTAQLVDAKAGNHIWSERYDRELKDIFAVQDEITKNIITAMQVKLTEGEQARSAAKGTKNLDAYLKYLQARNYFHKLNPEDNALAKQLAEEAIALDPNYAWAYYILGRAYMVDVWLTSTKSPKDSIAKSKELTQKALTLDDSLAEAYALLAYLFTMKGQHDEAVGLAEKAVALNPNSSDLHYRLGKIFTFVSRWEESLLEYKKAIRLDPIPQNYYLWSLGYAYAWTGQFEEAIKWGEKAVVQQPDDLFAHLMMAVVYSFSGREEGARTEAAEVLRINPKFSLEKYAKRVTYKNQEDKERLIDSLRKAGLK